MALARKPCASSDFLALRIDHAAGQGNAGIEVADVAVLVVVAGMQLVADAIGERQPRAEPPLILAEEMVVLREAVVVLLHHVIERLVGNAEQEVGEVHAGKDALAAAGVELVGAVVVRAVEAQRRDGFEVSECLCRT